MPQQAIISSFLDTVLARSAADGAYVYRFDADCSAACLAVAVGPPAEGRIARDHFDRSAPVVLHDSAWRDPRFAGFPEFAAHRFEGVASIPLEHGGARIGLVNVCPFRPASLAAGD